MFARTTLGLETVVQMGRAIKEAWCLADEWARMSSAQGRTLSLTYTLTPERIVLYFQADSLWLSRIPGLVDDATGSMHRASFNDILVDEADHSLTLIKYLPRDQ